MNRSGRARGTGKEAGDVFCMMCFSGPDLNPSDPGILKVRQKLLAGPCRFRGGVCRFCTPLFKDRMKGNGCMMMSYPCDNQAMSVSRSRTSRIFTVSFPEDLAKQVDRVARQESRNVSELFREAFRSYRLAHMHQQLDEARIQARDRKPQPQYTETDVERLVDEVRAETAAGGKKKA